MNEKVMRLAEEPNVWRPGGDDKRTVDERFVLWIGAVDHPAFTVVQRLRLEPDQVAPTVEEVRAVFRARGRSAATWEIGPSSRPSDLYERLTGLGMVDDDEPLIVGMVLRRSPGAPPQGVVVRRAITLDDYVTSLRVVSQGFSMGDVETAEQLERAPAAWAARQTEPHRETFVAYVDGEAVAAADLTYADGAAMFDGAATLERARGRGAYRALVSARWDAAQARGYDALVTQAGKMSRPILNRVGFEELCEVRVLLDRFD